MQAEEIKKFIEHPARLIWACRRGMLELDVILNRFLNEAYPALTHENKCLFIQLLDCDDPDLLAWLMGHEEPEDETLARIAHLVRQHARTPL